MSGFTFLGNVNKKEKRNVLSFYHGKWCQGSNLNVTLPPNLILTFQDCHVTPLRFIPRNDKNCERSEQILTHRAKRGTAPQPCKQSWVAR